MTETQQVEEYTLCRTCLNQLVIQKLKNDKKPDVYKSISKEAHCQKCNKVNRLFLISYKCNTESASSVKSSSQLTKSSQSTCQPLYQVKSSSFVPRDV